jgi:Smg protein
MKQTLLGVLILLYHNYLRKENHRLPVLEQWFIAVQNNQFKFEQLVPEFQLFTPTVPNQPQTVANNKTRVLSFDEACKMDPSCQGYLISLEHKGIITPLMREAIILKVTEFDQPVQIEQLRTIIHQTLLERSGPQLDPDILLQLFEADKNQVLH